MRLSTRSDTVRHNEALPPLTWLEDECLAYFNIATVARWLDALRRANQRADNKRSLLAYPVKRAKLDCHRRLRVEEQSRSGLRQDALQVWR